MMARGGLQAPVSYLNPNYMTSSVNNAYAVDVNGDGNIDIVGYDVNNNTDDHIFEPSARVRSMPR